MPLELDTNQYYYCDNTVVIPCDGARHSLDPTMGGHPDWYDGAGHVTEPGIYAVAVEVAGDTPATNRGLSVVLFTAWQSSAIYYIDQLFVTVWAGFSSVSFVEVTALPATPTRPFFITPDFIGEPDPSATIKARMQIARFAFEAGPGTPSTLTATVGLGRTGAIRP